MSNTSEASSAPSSPGDLNPDEVLYSPKPSPSPNNPSLSRRVGDMHLKVPGTCLFLSLLSIVDSPGLCEMTIHCTTLYPLSMHGRVFAAIAILGQATRSFQSHPIANSLTTSYLRFIPPLVSCRQIKGDTRTAWWLF